MAKSNWIEEGKFKAVLLKEILNLVKEELKNEGDCIGYTMPDEKYHIFIYVDKIDEKVFVIEPNRIDEGAHEPFVGDTYIVEFDDFGDLMVGCMWAMECFEKDMALQQEKVIEKYKEELESVKQKIFNSFKEGISTFELGGWENGLVNVHVVSSLFFDKSIYYATYAEPFYYDMEREGLDKAYEVISAQLAERVLEEELMWNEKKKHEVEEQNIEKISLNDRLANATEKRENFSGNFLQSETIKKGRE